MEITATCIKMKHQAWILPILAAVMLAPSQWNTASAQTAITFSFTGPGTGNGSTFSLAGSGTLTPYGATTIAITGGLANGSFTVASVATFGDGSTLSFSASPSVMQNMYSGTATITSGTGRFAGATGFFTFVVTVSSGANGTFSFTDTGSGTISTATHFVAVTPCRIADTRNPDGPFGGPAITGGASRDFAIPNSACGIPSTAAGYSLNVAVVPRGTLGFLTLWPSGQPQPLVATLNSIDGRIKSNAAIVPAGAGGAMSVFATDTTDVILDINGYFVTGSNPGALAFYPVTPCRVADTRNAAGPLGGPNLAAQSTRSFPILASSCGQPVSAQA